jgi:hypothetical protein
VADTLEDAAEDAKGLPAVVVVLFASKEKVLPFEIPFTFLP